MPPPPSLGNIRDDDELLNALGARMAGPDDELTSVLGGWARSIDAEMGIPPSAASARADRRRRLRRRSLRGAAVMAVFGLTVSGTGVAAAVTDTHWPVLGHLASVTQRLLPHDFHRGPVSPLTSGQDAAPTSPAPDRTAPAAVGTPTTRDGEDATGSSQPAGQNPQDESAARAPGQRTTPAVRGGGDAGAATPPADGSADRVRDRVLAPNGQAAPSATPRPQTAVPQPTGSTPVPGTTSAPTRPSDPTKPSGTNTLPTPTPTTPSPTTHRPPTSEPGPHGTTRPPTRHTEQPLATTNRPDADILSPPPGHRKQSTWAEQGFGKQAGKAPAATQPGLRVGQPSGVLPGLRVGQPSGVLPGKRVGQQGAEGTPAGDLRHGTPVTGASEAATPAEKPADSGPRIEQ